MKSGKVESGERERREVEEGVREWREAGTGGRQEGSGEGIEGTE